MKDLKKQRFGRLTVLDEYISFTNNRGRTERKGLFRCDCGTEKYILERSLLYGGIVGPNETTPNVFFHVEIVGSKVDNDYLGKTLTLTVKAQAVQNENNPITDGNTYNAYSRHNSNFFVQLGYIILLGTLSYSVSGNEDNDLYITQGEEIKIVIDEMMGATEPCQR